jgi:hypothetical protein
MADDKKGKKDEGPKPVENKLYQYIAEIIGLIAGVYLLAGFINQFSAAVNQRGYITSNPDVNNVLSGIYYGVASFLLFFTIFSNILSTLFLMGIIYAAIRIRELDKEIEDELEAEAAGVTTEEVNGNRDWQRIVDHINSENPNDWRLAIIEADIVLGEILEKMGLPGETIGDKLKAVEKSDFTSIDAAWEAHKVRNAIAHEGNAFQLNQREAKRVIGLYEQVFKEFHYI